MHFLDLWVEPCPDGVVLEDSVCSLYRDASSLREEEVSAGKRQLHEIYQIGLKLENI